MHVRLMQIHQNIQEKGEMDILYHIDAHVMYVHKRSLLYNVIVYVIFFPNIVMIKCMQNCCIVLIIIPGIRSTFHVFSILVLRMLA